MCTPFSAPHGVWWVGLSDRSHWFFFSCFLNLWLMLEGENSSQHVEDYVQPTESLLDGMVLWCLPSSLCWMAETAKPSVTLYFHLSANQWGEPLTERDFNCFHSLICSTGEVLRQWGTTTPSLIHGTAQVITDPNTSLHWAELEIKEKVLIQKSNRVPQRLTGDYYCNSC